MCVWLVPKSYSIIAIKTTPFFFDDMFVFFFVFAHILRNCIKVVISSICLRHDYFSFLRLCNEYTKQKSQPHHRTYKLQYLARAYKFINSAYSVILYKASFPVMHDAYILDVMVKV